MTRVIASASTLALALGLAAQSIKPDAGASSGVDKLLYIKRIYVAPLTGGPQADALRDLIIAGINSTRLFILTDNEERADAVLKGAADDHSFTDTFKFHDGSSAHENVTAGSRYSSLGVISESGGVAENETHQSRERKHEAYATVRLCNKDGDVLWSTTQESSGGKFRGASADVAAKIAHQITLDYQRARQADAPPAPATAPKP
jgi:putative lipoic acid-binding regulatory protein